MDRRDFLKTVAITGAALTIQRSEAMEVTIGRNATKTVVLKLLPKKPEPK